MNNTETSSNRYFTFIGCMFVACLLITNIASQKLIPIGPFVFAGGVLLFPITYIFGDILTEAYGYAFRTKPHALQRGTRVHRDPGHPIPHRGHAHRRSERGHG